MKEFDDADIKSSLARFRRLQRPAHHLLRSVIVLTAFKRLAHRRTKDVPTNLTSRRNESDRARGGHLRTA
jgi:hypothetical protein